ncbi:unnamed protein product [Trichobilharzia szidati]|nr:unnamed protein product [Trichobilharzia szidati]
MSTGVLKFIITAILLGVNIISSLIAFYAGIKGVNRDKFSSSWGIGFSVLNYFSIGLFMGISILSLYSSSAVKLHTVQNELSQHSAFKHYPISEALLCLGIFFLFICEWCSRKITKIVCRSSEQKSLNNNNFEFLNSVESVPLNGSAYLEDEIELLPVQEISDNNSNSNHHNNNFERNNTKIRRTSVCRNKVGKQGFSLGKSILLSCALSLHSFLEGLSFGLLDSFDQVVSMAVGMAMHQFLCAATLGFRLAQSSVTNTKRYITIVVLVCYLLVFPFGVSSGKKLYELAYTTTYDDNLTSTHANTTLTSPSSYTHGNSGQLMIGLLQNFAASSFLYVILFDMLPAVSSYGVKTFSTPSVAPASSMHHHCNSVKYEPNRIKRRSGILCFCSIFIGFMIVSGLRFLHHK